MIRALSLAAVLLFFGCERGRLTSVSGGWNLDRASVTFAPAFLGADRVETVTVRSQTQLTLSLKFAVPPPFSIRGAAETLPGGGEQPVELVFHPEVAGPVDSTLEVIVDGESREVGLHALGLAPTGCPASADSCTQSKFDPQSGKCLLQLAADGAACTPADQCVVAGACAKGVCLGQGNSCDDGNRCTLDSCGSEGGCAHLDIAWQCPAPTNPCQVPSCDPTRGCEVVDAEDGTACGPADCDFANICLSGVCQKRAVPEGGACGDESPCRARGACQQHLCVQPAPEPLEVAWTYQPPPEVHTFSFQGISDASEQLYWLECGELPINSIAFTCAAISHTRGNLERFRTTLTSARYQPISYAADRQLLWGTHFIFEAFSNEVTSVSTLDGAQEWSVLVDALVSAGPHDTANEFQISGVVADALGNLTVSIRRWDRTPTTATVRESALVILNAATGVVKRKQFLAGAVVALTIEPLGNSYLTVNSPLTSSVLALGPTGATRWTLPNSVGFVRSQWNGELLLHTGELRSTIDGSHLPSSLHYSRPAAPPALMATGHRYEFTSSCCEVCDCAYIDTSVILGSASGQADLVFSKQMGIGTLASTDGRLTDKSDALFGVGDNSSMTGSLYAITAAGDERFVCATPDPANITPEYYSRWWDSASLLKDLWVVKRSYSCTICDGNEVQLLTAFKVPGVRPAVTGWSGRGGGAAGNLGGW